MVGGDGGCCLSGDEGEGGSKGGSSLQPGQKALHRKHTSQKAAIAGISASVAGYMRLEHTPLPSSTRPGITAGDMVDMKTAIGARSPRWRARRGRRLLVTFVGLVSYISPHCILSRCVREKRRRSD